MTDLERMPRVFNMGAGRTLVIHDAAAAHWLDDLLTLLRRVAKGTADEQLRRMINAYVKPDPDDRDPNQVHTCSYQCERPACVRAQRDELLRRYDDTYDMLTAALEAERRV